MFICPYPYSINNGYNHFLLNRNIYILQYWRLKPFFIKGLESLQEILFIVVQVSTILNQQPSRAYWYSFSTQVFLCSLSVICHHLWSTIHPPLGAIALLHSFRYNKQDIVRTVFCVKILPIICFDFWVSKDMDKMSVALNSLYVSLTKKDSYKFSTNACTS